MSITLPATWQTIIILTISSILSICMYRLYAQYGKRQTNIWLTTLLVGATILVFLGIGGLIFSKYLTLPIRLVLTTSLVYGVLSSYYFFVFLLGDTEPYRPRDNIFPIVSVLLVFVLFIDYLRGENVGSFVINDPFLPNAINILYYTCLFLILPCMKLYAVYFLLRSLKRQSGDIALVLRRIIWITGFIIATLADLSVIVKLIAYISLSRVYQQGFSVFFFAATTVVTSLLLIAMLPQSIFAIFSYPIEHTLKRRRQQEDILLAHLHGLLVQIVTIIQLPDGYTSPARMLVEIGHARRIIGTTMQRAGPISLVDEARYIAHTVRAGMPVSEGIYPPFPKPRNARNHYIKLAHQLDLEPIPKLSSDEG